MKIKNQKGAVSAELAIVLPLLAFLLFAIIESSIFLYDKAMITNASREGARAGIVYSYPDRISDEEIEDVVRYYCETHLITFNDDDPPAPDPLIVEITRTVNNSSGDPLMVKVMYRYDFFVLPNMSGAFFTPEDPENPEEPENPPPPGIDLVAETVMRLE